MLRQYEAEDLAALAEQIHRENRRVTSTFLVLTALIFLMGVLYDRSSSFRFGMTLSVFLIGLLLRRNKPRRDAFIAAQNALAQSPRPPLAPLLQLRSTCNHNSIQEEYRLLSTCDSRLLRQLARATEGELDRLSPKERKILVRLLSQAFGSPLTKPVFQPNQEPSLSEAEPATAILLALTSLKQPGGERTARRILKHFKNEVLREAAQDYLKALSLGS